MRIFKYIPGKFILSVSLAFAFSTVLFALNRGGGEAIRFNSEYKLKRMSNGEVIISHSQDPGIKNLTFTDFYADILLAAYRNQKMDYIIRACAGKYFSSEDECRREVKHAVNVLSGWNIIIVDRTVAER